MGMQKVKIVQRFKAMRAIEIDVEADDPEEAVESVESGAIDTPDFDDPRWKTAWELMNEEVEAT